MLVMKRLPARPSPRVLRNAAMWTRSEASSTTVSGQTRAISSSLLTVLPACSSNVTRMSRARLPRRRGLPSSSKARSVGIRRNDPKMKASPVTGFLAVEFADGATRPIGPDGELLADYVGRLAGGTAGGQWLHPTLPSPFRERGGSGGAATPGVRADRIGRGGCTLQQRFGCQYIGGRVAFGEVLQNAGKQFEALGSLPRLAETGQAHCRPQLPGAGALLSRQFERALKQGLGGFGSAGDALGQQPFAFRPIQLGTTPTGLAVIGTQYRGWREEIDGERGEGLELQSARGLGWCGVRARTRAQ